MVESQIIANNYTMPRAMPSAPALHKLEAPTETTIPNPAGSRLSCSDPRDRD